MSFLPPVARLLRAQLLVPSALTTLLFGLSPVAVQSQSLGGFIELPASLSTVVEPLLSQSEINAFLPSKGKFTFPAPYNTQGVRLTNAADCGGGDCVSAIGYPYWRNMNNHVGSDTMLIMLGMNRSKGGKGLTLLQYNKKTEALTNLGPIFDANSPYGSASGEGWYFSATLPTKIYLNSGSKILRYDVISKQFETIVDVTSQFGSGHGVYQIHSSDDDRVHSATVKNASYAAIGCMVYSTDTKKIQFFPKKGDYDECQVDKSGKWLVIKENVDGAEGEDNRIINLATGSERLLRDSDGAGGHSDLGYGYMVANDNWAPKPNTWKVWDFNKSTLSGVIAYSNNDWNIGAPNHVTHTNAVNAAPGSQYSCGSSANRRNSAHANEIVCFMLDGSGKTLVVAPVMTSLDSRSADSYDNMPKGNLDVTGQYFIWTSNMGGSRLDAFLVKVPGQLLTGSAPVTQPPPVTNPTPIPTPEPTPVPVPTTPPPAPAPSGDTTPPVISNVSAGLITHNAAAIAWLTSELADGSIEYGKTSAYGMAASLGLSDRTLHAHILTGLEPNTTYHFRVQSADPSGNTSYSSDQTFTTAGLLPGNGGDDTAAPLLQNVRANNTDSGVTITWTTSEPAQQRVEYGLTTAYEHVTAISQNYATNHAVALDNLTPGKVYHFRVRSRDAAGNIATSPDFTMVATSASALGTPAPVVWTDLVNTFTSNGWVRKSSGCDGCPDAGAASQQNIEGRGYLEFTATVENSLRFIGLGAANTTTTASDIDFGLRLQGTMVEVRENGVYKWDTTFAVGDLFRISVDNGKVTYAKNGTVFYTSKAAPAAVLHGDVALYSTGSGIANAQIATPAGAASAASWTNLVNMTQDGDTLTKTGGCNGCADATAITSQKIASGNGHLQVAATVEDKVRVIGLTSTGTSLDYSMRLQGNLAEIRENGAYRWDTYFKDGDTLRITVENGVVSYVKNGVAFHTSAAPASKALAGAVLIYSSGGTVKDAKFSAQ